MTCRGDYRTKIGRNFRNSLRPRECLLESVLARFATNSARQSAHPHTWRAAAQPQSRAFLAYFRLRKQKTEKLARVMQTSIVRALRSALKAVRESRHADVL